MYVLGISGGVRQGLQDGSASLLKDGKVIAAVEEERLARVKHAPGYLPEKAVRFVLDKANIELKDVDYLVYPGYTYKNFKTVLSRYFNSKFCYCPEVELVYHHDAHCASAYYASGYDEAMIISMDFSGDQVSTQLAVGRNGKIDVLKKFHKPNSLGIFYSLITQFTGFRRDSDEYKVMGLSSYGKRGTHDLSWLLNFGNGDYELDPRYILIEDPEIPNPSKQESLYTDAFIEKLGKPRIPTDDMTEFYENIAASGQEHIENCILDLAKWLSNETGLNKLCMAGGVALNCVANQKLMNSDFIDELFIQPAASDAGLSLGGAYMVTDAQGGQIAPMHDVYYGPEYSDDEILEALKMTNVKYSIIDNIAEYAAKRVSEDKIVGWYQGRMEFGPRALGNRSILANPCNPDMQDIVNEKIKFREKFRPFTPSVLEEEVPKLFEGKMQVSPYMTITYDAKDGVKDIIPSVVHVDNTVRIQTVNENQNKLYYEYLQHLKKRLGYGITMNTSFNVKGDPIVNTPYHAISTFFGSGMDTLIMGNYVVEK